MPTRFHPIPGISLPIFRRELEAQTLFYAPGYLVKVESARAAAFASSLLDSSPAGGAEAGELRQHALSAIERRRKDIEAEFIPYCLTLYLHNRCNLKCGYCFSAPEDAASPAPPLTLDAIRAAAEIVARSCQQAGQRFTAVFHGGGEPALDPARAESALQVVEAAAAAFQLDIFRYIATNGALSIEQAAWLARRFDLIGLSCDGPASLQERHRPLQNGGSSTPLVERTADIVHAAGKPLHVRVTVTPDSLPELEAVAVYICEQLRPEEIHVEPVYQGGRAVAEACFWPDQAEEFTEAFFKARTIAHRHGVRWLASGSRPGEVHGPYCHILRNVLQLIPGDLVTNCFKNTTAFSQPSSQIIGRFDASSRSIQLDQKAIIRIQGNLRAPAETCAACFNQFHCAAACPDECRGNGGILIEAGFRCRVQALMAEQLLLETASGWKARAEIVGGKVSI